jgi:crotonobetainyl-CoA:carnitine CoA-transferase CaiB-like acyl-CoA transferase
VRVLDMTRLLPGPMCTLHLADLGADVIKIEDTGAGDYARGLAADPSSAPRAMSAWYRAINRNKRSLAIDLKRREGRDAFFALARDADAVVEGFRPGAVRALGVDYDAVRAVNPRVVYCALSGYGQTGPRALAAGHDVNYLGYAGVLNHTGERGGAPALASLQIADVLGGAATAAIGILAALFGALRQGRGRYVDVAMADAVLAHQVFALGALEDAGRVAPRGEDLLTGGVPCYGVYATRDGRWLAVGALEPKFWRALCEALERPDLAAHAFATGAEGARVRDALALVFAQRTRDEWSERLRGVDCCVTPVLTFPEALADRLGVPGAADRVGDADVKDALRHETEAAIARGVFGVPTLAVGSELFWGLDATEMALEFAHAGGRFDDPEYTRVTELPAAAVRRGAENPVRAATKR